MMLCKLHSCISETITLWRNRERWIKCIFCYIRLELGNAVRNMCFVKPSLKFWSVIFAYAVNVNKASHRFKFEICHFKYPLFLNFIRRERYCPRLLQPILNSRFIYDSCCKLNISNADNFLFSALQSSRNNLLIAFIQLIILFLFGRSWCRLTYCCVMSFTVFELRIFVKVHQTTFVLKDILSV